MVDKGLSADETDTVDVFHRGGFYLVQPRLGGHRSGMDAMLLAGLVPTGFKGKVVDLGAGAGAAGFAVAARCKDAQITLVERSAFMLEYAKKSKAHLENSYLTDRIEIIAADVTLRGQERINAGLMDNAFDFAIMNPPFNFASDRQTPDNLKAEAHVMPKDMFENWIRTATAIVKPSGYLGLIARPQSLGEILQALDGRFGDIKLIPLHPRKDLPAIRIFIHAKRGSKAPLSFLPALIMHQDNNQAFSPKVDVINNGRASFWDRA